ncbi:MAG: hypothetical protein CR997_07350 [Acidobacteria bacterium]|nr:MAG: hypothetical protein CR997_07350 [Acidobacteriota bacterium]
MKLGIMECVFRLQGCSSLKEKRKRLSGIRKLKDRQNLLFFEQSHHDTHTHSGWLFVAGAASEKRVDQILDKLEDQLLELVDADYMEVIRGEVDL